MFTFVSIFNFQTHKSLHLDLEKVTTIVGPTESGKSAVVRALRWVCLNKPTGLGFLRVGAKEVKVSLEVDDHTVVRLKGKKNVYRLDGEEYRSFGNDVPEAIAKSLGVDDVNFQRQLDPPFWLTDSPGQVAKSLNAIVDLDIVDESLAHVGREHRDARAVHQVTRDRIDEAQAQVDALSHVPTMRDEHQALIALHVEWDSTRTQEALLSRTVSNITKAEKELHTAQGPVGGGKFVVRVGEVWERASDAFWSLHELIRDIDEQQAIIKAARDEEEALKVELDNLVEEEICPTCLRPI